MQRIQRSNDPRNLNGRRSSACARSMSNLSGVRCEEVFCVLSLILIQEEHPNTMSRARSILCGLELRFYLFVLFNLSLLRKAHRMPYCASVDPNTARHRAWCLRSRLSGVAVYIKHKKRLDMCLASLPHCAMCIARASVCGIGCKHNVYTLRRSIQ